MGNINLGRVVIGGLAAGFVINFFEFLLNGVYFADTWPALMTARNLPAMQGGEILWFNVLGFASGIAAVWTYAAIRTRFGVGPRTAIIAALQVWVVGDLLPDIVTAIVGVYPTGMTATIVIVGLVELVIGTLLGGYLYKEA